MKVQKTIFVFIATILVITLCTCNQNDIISHTIILKGTGEHYSAQVDFDDITWSDLNEDQKKEIIIECITQVQADDEASDDFTIIGTEKFTKTSESKTSEDQQIFEYNAKDSCAYFDGISVEL